MQNDQQMDQSDLATDCYDRVELNINSDRKQSDLDESKFQKSLNIHDEDHKQTKSVQQNHLKTQIMINDKNLITLAHKSQQDQIVQLIQESIEQVKKESTSEITQQQQQYNKKQIIIKNYSNQVQKIKKYSNILKSLTICLNTQQNEAQQSKFYYQNCKVVLTDPITSMDSAIDFRLDNIKYCVGVGVGLKQILQKHDYDYKSTTQTELGHGLYIVTSQGYSWSHSEQDDDDIYREGFNMLYSGVGINVRLEGENLSFKWKKGSFSIVLPSRIRQKYTLCFCAYLHEKTDSISINN